MTTPLITDLPVYLTGTTALGTQSAPVFQAGFSGASPLTVGGGLIVMQGDSILPGGTTVTGGTLLLEADLSKWVPKFPVCGPLQVGCN